MDELMNQLPKHKTILLLVFLVIMWGVNFDENRPSLCAAIAVCGPAHIHWGHYSASACAAAI